ncbi:hypothetical protein ACFSQJ_12260 [Croceitalea marina]|uniref:Uncharacterized protein n=1 Tax=Croceitalea marina TaxID=1775166 RepID=A0ABW5MX22_9FLAO
MRKCAVLFIFLLLAIILFKANADNNEESLDQNISKELTSPENEGLVTN